METEKFELCIVVDSLSKPMVFDGDQFRYVSPLKPNSPKRIAYVLRAYTIKQANDHIKQHIAFRKAKGWDTSEMQIVPFIQ